jgi:hypothetical protein
MSPEHTNESLAGLRQEIKDVSDAVKELCRTTLEGFKATNLRLDDLKTKLNVAPERQRPASPAPTRREALRLLAVPIAIVAILFLYGQNEVAEKLGLMSLAIMFAFYVVLWPFRTGLDRVSYSLIFMLLLLASWLALGSPSAPWSRASWNVISQNPYILILTIFLTLLIILLICIGVYVGASQPDTAWYKKEQQRLRGNWPNVVMSTAALSFAWFCLVWVPAWWKQNDEPSDHAKAWFLGLWTLGVPVFFFIEWYLTVGADSTDTESAEFKTYEKNREAGQRVWLAIAALLTLLYFGDHLKNPLQKDVNELRERLAKVEQTKK